MEDLKNIDSRLIRRKVFFAIHYHWEDFMKTDNVNSFANFMTWLAIQYKIKPTKNKHLE